MKKQLLTTTALVAAGVLTVSGAALAGKPKLTVGGSTEQIIGVGSNSDAHDAVNGQRVGFDQQSDGEIHFNGSVTLDNGIKIRTRVELESNSADTTAGRNSNVINGAPGTASNGAGAGSADYIDEHWMRISGSFGEIRLGSGDAAGQAMTTGYLGTWSTGVGQLLAFDTTDWISRPAATASAGTVGRVDLSSDSEQISYYTPRFAGFQLGMSYIPSAREDVNNQRELAAGADRDGWSMGANFVKKFGGVGVGVSAGYATNDESTANRSDDSIWGIGARIDFSGFRIGMSFVDNDSQETNGVTVSAGVETFEAGVRYMFGPNAVSLTHLSAETTASSNAAGAGDETTVTALAFRRTLGPGVSWKVTAMFADFENGTAGAAEGTSNNGEALTTSLSVRF